MTRTKENSLTFLVINPATKMGAGTGNSQGSPWGIEEYKLGFYQKLASLEDIPDMNLPWGAIAFGHDEFEERVGQTEGNTPDADISEEPPAIHFLNIEKMMLSSMLKIIEVARGK